MRRKSEAAACVKRICADINGLDTISCFRTDTNGGFMARRYTDLCNSPGIRRAYMARGTPKQEAMVERDPAHECRYGSPSRDLSAVPQHPSAPHSSRRRRGPSLLVRVCRLCTGVPSAGGLSRPTLGKCCRSSSLVAGKRRAASTGTFSRGCCVSNTRSSQVPSAPRACPSTTGASSLFLRLRISTLRPSPSATPITSCRPYHAFCSPVRPPGAAEGKAIATAQHP